MVTLPPAASTAARAGALAALTCRCSGRSMRSPPWGCGMRGKVSQALLASIRRNARALDERSVQWRLHSRWSLQGAGLRCAASGCPAAHPCEQLDAPQHALRDGAAVAQVLHRDRAPRVEAAAGDPVSDRAQVDGGVRHRVAAWPEGRGGGCERVSSRASGCPSKQEVRRGGCRKARSRGLRQRTTEARRQSGCSAVQCSAVWCCSSALTWRARRPLAAS